MGNEQWYEVKHPEKIDSPALLIFPDRVASNIQAMIRIAGDVKRLAPHVKTHKMAEVVRMQMEAGITRFKCATIAEAEMLALAGAKDILLAYQLTLPKALRFLALVKKYPESNFSSLVDNFVSAKMVNDLFAKDQMVASVFIDVDSGMHRTGIAPGTELFDLYLQLQLMKNIQCMGLHAYDGHLHEENFEKRKKECEEGFAGVRSMVEKIIGSGYSEPLVIAGGSPTFTVYALHEEIICSPGTCLLWDYGYHTTLKEQPFDMAAVLLTRIISKPSKGLITTDLGHKSVAAENILSKRIFFLNLDGYEVRSQSEEHLVVEVENWESVHVGDVLYGVPYHICPTVALYDEVYIIKDGQLTDTWEVIARKRKLTV